MEMMPDMMPHKRHGFVHKYLLCHCNNGVHRQGGGGGVLECIDGFFEKPCGLAWMNKKGIARIAEVHLHHICETDVSDRLWSLFVEDRGCQEAYRPSRTKESWLVQGDGVWGTGAQTRTFLFGYYTLCLQPKRHGGSYGGAVTPWWVVSQKPPVKCQTQLMKIWHIVPRPQGRCTIFFSLSWAGLSSARLFPQMDAGFMERCGANASYCLSFLSCTNVNPTGPTILGAIISFLFWLR